MVENVGIIKLELFCVLFSISSFGFVLNFVFDFFV